MAELPTELQAEVAERIGSISSTSPWVIKAIEQVMKSKFTSFDEAETEKVGGVNTLVNILNSASRSTEKNIIDDLENVSRNSAQKSRPTSSRSTTLSRWKVATCKRSCAMCLTTFWNLRSKVLQKISESSFSRTCRHVQPTTSEKISSTWDRFVCRPSKKHSKSRCSYPSLRRCRRDLHRKRRARCSGQVKEAA